MTNHGEASMSLTGINPTKLQDVELPKSPINDDVLVYKKRHNSGHAINESQRGSSDLFRDSSGVRQHTSSVKVIAYSAKKKPGKVFFQNLEPDLFRVTQLKLYSEVFK